MAARDTGARSPQHGIRDGAGDVPRLGVAELRHGRARRSSCRPPCPSRNPLTVTARKRCAAIGCNGSAELGAWPWAKSRHQPSELRPGSLADQGPLEFGQCADGSRRRHRATGQRFEIDIVHRRLE